MACTATAFAVKTPARTSCARSSPTTVATVVSSSRQRVPAAPAVKSVSRSRERSSSSSVGVIRAQPVSAICGMLIVSRPHVLAEACPLNNRMLRGEGGGGGLDAGADFGRAEDFGLAAGGEHALLD